MKKALKDALLLSIPTCILIIIEECVSNIANIFMAKIMGEFTNNILHRNFDLLISSLYSLIFILLVTLIVVPLIGLLTNSIMLKDALKHDFIALNNFYKKIYLKALQSNEGEVLNRIEEAPSDLRYSIIDMFTEPIIVIITAYTLIKTMFSINIKYSLFCIVLATITLLIPIITRKMEAKYSLKTKDFNDYKMKLERELIENHTYLKFTNMYGIFIEDYQKFFYESYKTTHKKYSKYISISNFIKEYYKKICVLFIVFFGLFLVKQNEIELGNIVTFISYLYTTQYIIERAEKLLKMRLMLKQNVQRLDLFYEEQEPINEKIIDNYIKKIQFKNLILKLDNIKQYKINYEINKGEIVSIIGENGSGKSTLLKCLIGLYDNYEGDILINGINVKELDLNCWRSKISYVPQNPFLFKTSIKNNILFDSNVSNEQLNDILNLLNFNLDLEKIVTKGGINLSGGEKQKISIARALLKKCEVIILDEPFNNLDDITKQNIYNFLKNNNLTVIFISHDNSLHKLSDKVLKIM